MESLEVIFNLAKPFTTPEEYKAVVSTLAFALGSMEKDASPEVKKAYKDLATVCKKFAAACDKLEA